jgi:uncharacterized DUF497 family protein
MSIEFARDEKKAEVNAGRHGISFEEAMTVFRTHWPVFSKIKYT